MQMGVTKMQELASIRDAASCRDWLLSLDLPMAERAERIEQLFDALDSGSNAAADTGEIQTAEILEQARLPYLQALNENLRLLADDPLPFPLPAPAWATLSRSVDSLRRLRELYRRIDGNSEVTVIDAPSGPMRRLRERAAQTLQSVLPLMRALDCQCRLIHALLLFQVHVEQQEWATLADLAAQARATTFLDAPLPDQLPIVKNASARSLFVSTLLLRAARIDTHDPYQRALIDRMARHWSGRVGFRIDEGAHLHSNRNGPTIVLNDQLAVRLDTQSLLRKLDERCQSLRNGTGIARGLPRGMGRSKAVKLLDALRVVWGAAEPPALAGTPVNCAAAMHMGLPNFLAHSAASSAAMELPAAAMAYDYGRYEQDTLIRQSSKLGRDTPHLLAQLHANLIEQAEPVDWLTRNGNDARIERCHNSAIGHNVLLVLHARQQPVPAHVALPDRAAIWLGRLTGMEQYAQVDRAGRRVQRLSVNLWSIPATVGAMRLSQSALFEPVYYLPALDGCGASVFLPPGCWRPLTSARLRLPDQEWTVTLEHAIEQGPGYERVLLSGFTDE